MEQIPINKETKADTAALRPAAVVPAPPWCTWNQNAGQCDVEIQKTPPKCDFFFYIFLNDHQSVTKTYWNGTHCKNNVTSVKRYVRFINCFISNSIWLCTYEYDYEVLWFFYNGLKSSFMLKVLKRRILYDSWLSLLYIVSTMNKQLLFHPKKTGKKYFHRKKERGEEFSSMSTMNHSNGSILYWGEKNEAIPP